MIKKTLSKINTEQVNYLFDVVENLIINIINKSMHKISMDELLELYSKTIDNFILETEKNERLRFIAGNLSVTCKDEFINMNIECYFQDVNKRWIKKSTDSKIEMFRIKKESIVDREIKFEIEHP
ncbi:hypothetical protein QJR60_11415 [Paraclostridium sordellii]|uniref:hypothetical protein n=1 Tax=Paraclostridium sordellii TaxID=1505 RepID=UPI002900F2D0|nr:hypothetical protein [Paeniclostridium sordellii]